MKKIIRLTESDLLKIVNKVLNEQSFGGFGGGSSGGAGASGSWGDNTPKPTPTPTQAKIVTKVPITTPKPKPKFQWTPCNGFPLKYGQHCKLVARLQGAIGAMDSNKPADGYFGKKTEAALRIYYPQYQRSIGVSKEEFDKLMVPKAPLNLSTK